MPRISRIGTSDSRRLPANPRLYDLAEFTHHGENLRNRAFEAIRRLPTRQADAEDYLVNGVGWPLVEIEQINIEATPKFCELARKKLADCAKSISPPVPGRPYDWEKAQVDPYLAAMKWLLDHHCDCMPEVTAVETAVRAYPRAADRDQTLAALAAMRQNPSR